MATKASGGDQKAVSNVDRHELTVRERFTDEQLRSVKTLEDVTKLLVGAYGDVKSIDEFELGTGFKLLDNDEKARLVGVPFIIISAQFNEGDYGDDFVSIMLMTADANNDRLILNDGSTGICTQMREIVDRTGRSGGIAVPNGLRVSEYDTCVECGKPRKQSHTECKVCGDTNTKRAKGATYYLDVS